MKTVVERFLKYVSFDTASMHDQDAIPVSYTHLTLPMTSRV